MTSRPQTAETQRTRRALAISLGERAAPAAHVRGYDAERARRRPLLEGVRQPDRARQDAPDGRDDRVARRPARRRRRFSRERRLGRRARPGRDRPRPRGGADRGRAATTRRSTSTRTSQPAVVATGAARARGRARSGGQASRHACRGKPREALVTSTRRARAVRGPGLLGRRPGATSSSASASPLHALEHLDRGRAASTRRSSSPSARGCRATCCGRTSSSWRSRCYRRQRDFEAAREDVERALELAEGLNDRRDDGRTSTSRPRCSPSATATGCSPATTPSARSPSTRRSPTARTSASCSTTSAASTSCSASPTRRSATSRTRSATAARVRQRRRTPRTRSTRSRRCTSAPATSVLAEEQARQALELLEGPRRPPRRDRQRAARARARAARAGSARRGRGARSRAAESSFDQLSSASHRAAAWIAQGDLATRRGDDRVAAGLYRRAAEALQDVRF